MDQGQGLHEETGCLPWRIPDAQTAIGLRIAQGMYRSPLDSAASSGGEEECAEDDDYSRTPRGVLEPILT